MHLANGYAKKQILWSPWSSPINPSTGIWSLLLLSDTVQKDQEIDLFTQSIGQGRRSTWFSGKSSGQAADKKSNHESNRVKTKESQTKYAMAECINIKGPTRVQGDREP